MKLLRIAHVPSAAVTPDTTVYDAVALMARHRVGAVAVVDQIPSGSLVGIFTERDLMLRVVNRERSSRETLVHEVMTSSVKTATEEMAGSDVLSLMRYHHLRHLPILSPDGRLLGMLSVRDLLESKLDGLTHELHSLDQYLLNDGPGG